MPPGDEQVGDVPEGKSYLNAVKIVSKAADEWFAKQSGNPGFTGETPEEAAPTQVEPKSGIFDSAVNQRVKVRPSKTLAKTTASPVIAELKGTIEPGLTPPEQERLAVTQDKELAFDHAQYMTRLRESQQLEDVNLMGMEIAETDAKLMRELNSVSFSKWDSENQKLSADIDEARQLRINPHSYLQSIGTGGRVASVFAAGASQLAAGAGNVSSVIKRIDSAIERDISAQEANLKASWDGIKVAQGQQDRERDVLNDFFIFRDRARAIHYTSLAAQAGAIKQHAHSETLYQSYLMLESRAEAKALVAIAATRAKIATLHVKIPITKAHSSLVQAQKFTQQSLGQMQLGPGQAAAPVQGAQQPALGTSGAGQPTTPSPAPTTVPSSAPRTTRASSAGTRTPPGQAPANQSLSQGVTDNVPPALARPQTSVGTTAATQEQPEAPKAKSGSNLAKAYAAVDRNMSVHPQLAAAGSWGRLKAGNRIDRESLPTQRESLDMLVAHPFRALNGYATATTAEDAADIMAIDSQYFEPETPKEVQAIVAKYNSNKDLSKAEIKTLRAHKFKKAAWAQRTTHMDFYRELFIDPDTDDQNYQDTDLGRLRIKAGFPAIKGGKEGATARKEIIQKANDIAGFIMVSQAQSQVIGQRMTGNVLGLFNVSRENGITFFPQMDGNLVFGEHMTASMLQKAGAEVMKMVDPSGRLTDKDIEVGRTIFAGNMFSGKTAGWNAIETAVRTIKGFENAADTEIHHAVNRVLRYLTIGVAETLVRQLSANGVMMSPEAMAITAGRVSASEEWLFTNTQPDNRKSSGNRLGLAAKTVIELLPGVPGLPGTGDAEDFGKQLGKDFGSFLQNRNEDEDSK